MPHLSLINDLKAQLAGLASKPGRMSDFEALSVGVRSIDDHLGNGVNPFAVHELWAESSFEAPSASAFALGLALRTAGPLVWVTDERASHEVGALYGSGLHEWGGDPDNLLLIKVRSVVELLAAGEEALGSGSAGAVVLCGWGDAPALTLTASRRLSLAAARGRSTGFFVRAAARSSPSAAETRWLVRAAPSRPWEAGSPGFPTFAVQLTRSRSGAAPREWIVEWDRERQSFSEPASIPGGLVSIPAQRQTGTRSDAGRRSAA